METTKTFYPFANLPICSKERDKQVDRPSCLNAIQKEIQG